MDESDEFKLTRGLGLIDGKVTKLQIIENEDLVQKVPHIGWARINRGETFSSWESTLLQENSSGDYCYFVHSYHVQPTQKSSILATASFNGIEIVAAIQKDNIYAFQFHPEKSGEVGLKILSRFCHD